MKVQNKSNGPRAINTAQGVVILQPGESGEHEISDADAKAYKATGFLDAVDGAGAPSLADMQRDIASMATPATPSDEQDAGNTGDGLPGEDDPDVVALVGDSSATELQKIAADEKVDMAGAKNKTDAARRIVAARRAAGPQTGSTSDEVDAMIAENDEAALRQIAEDEGVAIKSDDDKADIAAKIIAARNA